MEIERPLILDANVLIDYTKANKKVLSRLTSLVDVFVPVLLFDELNNLTEDEALKLGLRIHDTPLEIVGLAVTVSNGTSFYDKICMFTAQTGGFILVTNDKKLRKECVKDKVDILWGLEIMLFLVEKEKLTRKEAEKTFEKIRLDNPRITADIAEEFLNLLHQNI